MSESRRYQRLREEMGCGTGGIVRVPGMQQVAPPSAYLPEELLNPTKPDRAANPFVEWVCQVPSSRGFANLLQLATRKQLWLDFQ